MKFSRGSIVNRRSIPGHGFLGRLFVLVIGFIMFYIAAQILILVSKNYKWKEPEIEGITDIKLPSRKEIQVRDDDYQYLSRVCHFRDLTAEKLFSGTFNVLQDDYELLGYVKTCVLIRPSISDYNVDTNGSDAVGRYVQELLNKTRGIFVDCGAGDGETQSNTLYLEKYFDWMGLLIESDPIALEVLLEKNRRAWAAGMCAGNRQYPFKANLLRYSNATKKMDTPRFGLRAPTTQKKVKYTAECIPLFSLMLSLNLQNVDYLSMNIETALSTLRTIPFAKIQIKVISVNMKKSEERPDIQEFLQLKGYKFAKRIIVLSSATAVFMYDKPYNPNLHVITEEDEAIELTHTNNSVPFVSDHVNSLHDF